MRYLYTLMALLPLFVFIFLLLIARWARKRSAQLHAREGPVGRRNAYTAFRAGQIRQGLEYYYLTNLPGGLAILGRSLVALVGLCFLGAFLLFVFQ